MSPLVSFLIPAYNHAGFVAQCLDSILADTYDNKELVIIDDGSRDATADVIRRWIAEHEGQIRAKFRLRPNKGVTATLNELLSLAEGEFVRLGASDDYFLPAGTRLLVDYLLGNPAKAAVFGDYTAVDERGNVLHQSGMVGLHGARKEIYRSGGTGLLKAVIKDWAVAGPVTLVRRSAFDSIGAWDEKLRIDDWDFFLRIASKGGWGFIDAQVCAYRLHGSNTCRVTDVPTRIRNQQEWRSVAERHAASFERPYRELLQAQGRLADAKIAYLRRRPIDLMRHLLAYARLRAGAALAEQSSDKSAQ